MRAEGPKERPTAVLCVQLSARYVQIRKTAKSRNTTRRSRVNAIAIAMSSYSVVRHVNHGASSRRDRELKYSSQPIAKNQATITPNFKRGSLPVTLLFADI